MDGQPLDRIEAEGVALANALGMAVVGTKRDLDDAPAAVDDPLPADESRELLSRADYTGRRNP